MYKSIKYPIFLLTDQVEKSTVQIKYCSMDDMVGDYMSKGPQGVKFDKFRNIITGKDQ